MKGCRVVSIIHMNGASYETQGGRDRSSGNKNHWNGYYFNVLKEDFIAVFGVGSAGSNNAPNSSSWGSNAVFSPYRYRINNDRTITKTGNKFGQVTLKASVQGKHMTDWGTHLGGNPQLEDMVFGRFNSGSAAGDWKVNDIISKDPLTDEEIYEVENKWRIFDYTGTEETFTLPDNITSVNVYLWGAGGGSGYVDGRGGAGALVYGNLNVLNVNELKITVGEGGHKWGDVYDGTIFGNGGKGANNGAGTSGSGGGLSGIKINDVYTVIAGAGGGGGTGYGGANRQGGMGTFEKEGSDSSGHSTLKKGKGGTQSEGGSANGYGSYSGISERSGGPEQGGNGDGFSGAGGSGYYGGGGGDHSNSLYGTGGGGGSSLTNNLNLITGLTTLGENASDISMNIGIIKTIRGVTFKAGSGGAGPNNEYAGNSVTTAWDGQYGLIIIDWDINSSGSSGGGGGGETGGETISLEKKIEQSKQRYGRKSGSMLSLINKKYISRRARITKLNFYDPTDRETNKILGQKNPLFKRKGKPLKNASLGSAGALSNHIQRRIL